MIQKFSTPIQIFHQRMTDRQYCLDSKNLIVEYRGLGGISAFANHAGERHGGAR
jgi:hypothetical protein